jgi:hypothetical protein
MHRGMHTYGMGCSPNLLDTSRGGGGPPAGGGVCHLLTSGVPGHELTASSWRLLTRFSAVPVAYHYVVLRPALGATTVAPDQYTCTD